MGFRITGLQRTQFQPLFGMPAQRLQSMGIERVVADAHPGYPDRISLDDVTPGGSVLLMNYVHQPARTPFHSSHAIYVSEAATHTWDREDQIPPALSRRVVSLRAFDRQHRMIDADIEEGSALVGLIERLLRSDSVAYLHAHFAKRGCYAARVDRA